MSIGREVARIFSMAAANARVVAATSVVVSRANPSMP